MTYVKRPSAFTLIELLVVIAIIGLLATLAAVGLNTARAKSRDTKRVSDLNRLQKALEVAFRPAIGYPVANGSTGGGLVLGTPAAKVLCDKTNAGVTSVNFVADTSSCDAASSSVYMALVPINPTVGGGADYVYKSYKAGASCASAPCDSYCIQSTLEQGLPADGLSANNFYIDPNTFKNGSCP